MIKVSLLIFAVVSLFLVSCSDASSHTNDSLKIINPPHETDLIASVDTFYNSITQLIGGVDSLIDYSKFSSDTILIKKYCATVETKYNKIKNDRLERISLWNSVNIDRNKKIDTTFAFYPFSGGDFIHLNWLYPNANEYLMVAREDVGNVPNLLVNPKMANVYLNNVDIVLRDIYYKSYFITRNMIYDINKQARVNGMLPLLLWAAARTDHEILGVKFGSVSADGKLIHNQKNKLQKHDAVEILFRKRATTQQKKLTYLSCDISDKGFLTEQNYYKYLQTKVPSNCHSFVKSASYMLHYKGFSKMRDLILNKSDFLVQDDTGIPFKHFNKKNWNIELFGQYDKPVSDFKMKILHQLDLDSAYKIPTYYKGKLNFSLGYHWGSDKQNEMVLSKIKINN
ncbi:MAG: hypothetical protein EB100_00275 [Crocinitomicaceae bacterium]|nr:hypothetical protein [Crocinitomicaceae bacterium]